MDRVEGSERASRLRYVSRLDEDGRTEKRVGGEGRRERESSKRRWRPVKPEGREDRREETRLADPPVATVTLFSGREAPRCFSTTSEREGGGREREGGRTLGAGEKKKTSRNAVEATRRRSSSSSSSISISISSSSISISSSSKLR